MHQDFDIVCSACKAVAGPEFNGLIVANARPVASSMVGSIFWDTHPECKEKAYIYTHPGHHDGKYVYYMACACGYQLIPPNSDPHGYPMPHLECRSCHGHSMYARLRNASSPDYRVMSYMMCDACGHCPYVGDSLCMRAICGKSDVDFEAYCNRIVAGSTCGGSFEYDVPLRGGKGRPPPCNIALGRQAMYISYGEQALRSVTTGTSNIAIVSGAEAPKVEESKPSEAPKPVEPKPVESKPSEAPKPVESKPAEAPKMEAPKSVEPKPAEASKPEASKPVESKPAEIMQLVCSDCHGVCSDPQVNNVVVVMVAGKRTVEFHCTRPSCMGRLKEVPANNIVSSSMIPPLGSSALPPSPVVPARVANAQPDAQPDAVPEAKQPDVAETTHLYRVEQLVNHVLAVLEVKGLYEFPYSRYSAVANDRHTADVDHQRRHKGNPEYQVVADACKFLLELGIRNTPLMSDSGAPCVTFRRA
jgi:hypothetical protein